MEEYDFVAIGDITTDAFIRLKDAHKHCNIDTDACELCVSFGDKIPYEFVKVVAGVGNSPNAAVSATRLGLKAGLLTDIGSDQNGQDCLNALKENNVDVSLVRTHEGKITNYHYVLWYEAERTILIKHEDYEYHMPDIKAKWLYFSSVGENSLAFHHELAQYLKDHPETKFAFQPGTFQIKLGAVELKDMYEECDIFFCNVEEAQKILGETSRDLETLLNKMHDLGPDMVVITDGPAGAYALKDGVGWFMPPYPDPKDPLDRTGAGDSFSSTFVSAIALGMTLPQALEWAPINSMSVVQGIGAQEGLLDRTTLEEFLKNRPDDYVPKKIF